MPYLVSQTITFKAKWTSINHSLLHKLGILLSSALGCIVHTYELSIVLLYIEVDVKMGEKEVNQNNHKMNWQIQKPNLNEYSNSVKRNSWNFGQKGLWLKDHKSEKVICIWNCICYQLHNLHKVYGFFWGRNCLNKLNLFLKVTFIHDLLLL